MTANTTIELEQRLAMMQAQFERSAVELKRLQANQRFAERRQTGRGLSSRLPLFVGLSLVALALTLGLSTQSQAQSPVTNTILKWPILVQDASGNTILEISDRPKHYGITLYNKAGGQVAFLGITSGGGILGIQGTDAKLLADISEDGFKFFGKSEASVAFMGADTVGNGAIQLKNTADGVVVNAGVFDGATGFVQVYPRSGKTPFPIPNYLKGGK